MTTQTTNRWRFRKQSRPYGESAETGYHALAAAIVKQAVEDYRTAEKMLANVPNFAREGDRRAYVYQWEKEKRDIVRFFRSQWYGTLFDIPCEKILKHLGVKA